MALSTFATTIFAIVLIALGHGPVRRPGGPADTVTIILAAFLVSALLCGLPMAATLEARKRLKAEKARLTLLTDNIGDAILRYDLAGICTYGSPSVAAVLGYAPERLMGRRMSDAIHPETADRVLAAEARLLRGESKVEKVVYRRPRDDNEGRAVHIEAHCAIAQDARTGEPDGIVVCARDVSERVRLEQELRDARMQAEEADSAKSRFLADMSNEIRAPMNGVLGFAELLQRSDLPPELERHVDLIVHSGHAMMAILNDVLDLSRIEAGEIAVAERPVNVARIVEECISLHRAPIDEKKLELAVGLDPDMPAAVSTDPLRLHQILANLLSNAAKFTCEGTVGVSLDFHGDGYVVSVSDTGIGVPEDQVETIFEPFARTDKGGLRRCGGNGLSLAISRRFAGLLGGTLEVESTPGGGATFSLRLPYRPAQIAQPAERRGHRVEAELRSGQGRVLLVEDHEIDRTIIRRMLATCNLAVETARDGNKAVDLVLDAEHADRPYDLVLMDLQMPACDGYEAARAIRLAGVSAQHLPIIAVTANMHADGMSAARKAGMQGYLAKPVVFDDLRRILNRWLPHRIVGDDQHVRRLDPDMARVEARWRTRREHALEAARETLREEELAAERVQDIAAIMQKLAGSAAMFGERELGQRAASLERALRSGAGRSLRRRLARELIGAA
ncbi:MAG: response regulator [Erythrobacter sp.]|nr:response regulator [Erythrobacter sp.]